MRQVDNRKKGGRKNHKEFAACRTCGKEFGFYRCLSKGWFCSKDCYRADWKKNWAPPAAFTRKGQEPWNKGKTDCYTEEQLARIRNGMKGRKLSEAHRKKIGEFHKGNKWALGKHWKQTPESNKKRSKAMVGRPHPWNRGEKCNLWRGGVCEENREMRYYLMGTREYRQWRRKVLERDRYACVTCGFTGPRMEADHIEMVVLHPELAFVVGNGQTLCRECHAKKTREDFKLLYQNGKKIWKKKNVL